MLIGASDISDQAIQKGSQNSELEQIKKSLEMQKWMIIGLALLILLKD